MARLPVVGGDDNDWGSVLNSFLAVAHNTDGTIQQSAIASSGGVTAVNGKTPSNGVITLAAADVGAIVSSSMGAANGVATLNNTTQVPLAQLGNGSVSAGKVLTATSASAASWSSQTYGYPGATLLVAASNSTARAKSSADYVCTGSNDDTTINTALAALGSSPGGVVLLAEGDYTIGNTGIQILSGDQHLYGLGDRAGVVIHAGTSSAAAMVIVGTSGTGNLYNNSVRHLTLDGTGGGSSLNGINASSNMFKAEDLYIASMPQDGISLSSFTTPLEFAFQKVIDVNIYRPGRDGVVTDTNIYDMECIGVTVSGNFSGGTGRYGYNIAGSYCRLIGCRADDMMTGWGVIAQNSAFELQILGGHFDENGADAAAAGNGANGQGGGGIIVNGNARVTVTGVEFNSNGSYDVYISAASNYSIVGCQSNGAGNTPNTAGIYVTGGAGGVIADNALVDMGSRAVVVAFSSSVAVHDNIVTNPTTTPSNPSVRVYAANNCSIHHNQLSNGISEENTSNTNLFEQNYLTGGSIAVVGASTTVIPYGAGSPLAGMTMSAYLAPKVAALTDGSSVAVNATQGNVFDWPLGGTSHTLATPSNAVNGDTFTVRIAYSGVYTPLFSAAYDFGIDGQPTWTATSGKADEVAFRYNGNISKWCCQGWKLGF